MCYLFLRRQLSGTLAHGTLHMYHGPVYLSFNRVNLVGARHLCSRPLQRPSHNHFQTTLPAHRNIFLSQIHIYGLTSETERSQCAVSIASFDLVPNPSCYPTAMPMSGPSNLLSVALRHWSLTILFAFHSLDTVRPTDSIGLSSLIFRSPQTFGLLSSYYPYFSIGACWTQMGISPSFSMTFPRLS